MKLLQLLLSLIILTSSYSFGQYSRAFFINQDNSSKHHEIIEFNGETKVLSVNESSGDTLRVTIVSIDTEGETTDYATLTHSPFTIESGISISGATANVQGNVVICLNQQTSSGLKVQYITIDGTTGAFSSITELPNLYFPSGIQSRVKGDSLVSYFSTNTGGQQRIDRISVSLSNTLNYSEELVTDSLFVPSSVIALGQRRLDFLIDGTDEYIHFGTSIFKRTAAGNYISNSTSGIPIGAPVIIKNTVGEIVAITGNKADVFDVNLNLISSNTIQLPIIFNNYIEVIPTPTGYHMYIRQPSGSAFSFHELDLSFTIIESGLRESFIPLSRKEINNKHYIIGFRSSLEQRTGIDGSVFTDGPELTVVICDDLTAAPKEFIEYNRFLTNGQIKFSVGHLGLNFTNFNESGLQYNLSNSYRGLGYASSQSTMNKTSLGDVQGLYLTYGTDGTFVPGPYTSIGQYDHLIEDKYNRGYYVSKDMIEAHITAIGTNDPNYVMPRGIREWPTHGDVSKGQAELLAAYVDRNQNGVYDPENGDYPSIYGDQCFLNIYHQHPLMSESNSIETHEYYFTFNCSTSEPLNNTVFIRHHEFTREQNLVDVYHSTFMDFDIGNAFDDFCGTNVELGLLYGYNGDALDETNGSSIGFNDTLPYFGVLPLQGTKLPETGVDLPVGVNQGESINGIGFGDGIPNNEFYTLESSLILSSIVPSGIGPFNLASAYEVAQGNYGNGSPKLVDTVTVRHDLFGDSDPLYYSSMGVNHGNNYSEETENNPPGDRRAFLASGPAKFDIGDTMILINAYVVGIDTVNIVADSSKALLFNHAQALRNMYSINLTPCGGDFGTYVSDNDASTDQYRKATILVYPNPAQSSFQLIGITGQADIQMIDLNGRVVDNWSNLVDGDQIGVGHLRKSIYFVSISDESGTHVLRIVLN